MYIIKSQGTDKIPDFVQVRNSDFVLINHFKVANADKDLDQMDSFGKKDDIIRLINELPYGALTKVTV